MGAGQLYTAFSSLVSVLGQNFWMPLVCTHHSLVPVGGMGPWLFAAAEVWWVWHGAWG